MSGDIDLKRNTFGWVRHAKKATKAPAPPPTPPPKPLARNAAEARSPLFRTAQATPPAPAQAGAPSPAPQHKAESYASMVLTKLLGKGLSNPQAPKVARGSAGGTAGKRKRPLTKHEQLVAYEKKLHAQLASINTERSMAARINQQFVHITHKHKGRIASGMEKTAPELPEQRPQSLDAVMGMNAVPPATPDSGP